MLFKELLQKRKKLKASSLVFCGLLGGVFVGTFFFFQYKQQDQFDRYRSDLTHIAQARQHVRHMIEIHGSVSAYHALEEEVTHESLEYQRDIAHIFGEELYKVEGLNGLHACDHTLLNGCFHGVLLSTIGREGLQAIDQVEEICQKDGEIDLACHHGIGHGFGEYFGPQNLNQQFEACTNLSWKKPVGGCVGGVMMEYHFPSLLDEKNQIIGIKRFDPKRPYDPCDSVAEAFKNSCAYYIPRWWKSVIDYQQIGKLCDGFETKDQQWYCYHGAGYIAAHFTDFNVEKTKQLCDLMPNQPGRLWCRMSAAWSFETSPVEHDRQLWQEICQDLDGDEAACIVEHDFDFVMITLPDISTE